jgi:hypothetical protein
VSYAKAHDLLRRWLRYDVGETDDPTLEAETTAWMIEHPLPLIADDDAMLKACSDLVITESEEGILRFGAGAVALVTAEWTRRDNRARAAQFRRGMERAAPELARAITASWRRLESNR